MALNLCEQSVLSYPHGKVRDFDYGMGKVALAATAWQGCSQCQPGGHVAAQRAGDRRFRWLRLGEPLTLRLLLAFASILAGIALVIRKQAK